MVFHQFEGYRVSQKKKNAVFMFLEATGWCKSKRMLVLMFPEGYRVLQKLKKAVFFYCSMYSMFLEVQGVSKR